MAAPAIRRADFLMALAYATDLATGHSRDFALRSCVLGMRFVDDLFNKPCHILGVTLGVPEIFFINIP